MHVEVCEEDGDLLVRDALVAAFFCQGPYPHVAPAFGRVFEEWFAQAPADAKRWALVGPDAEEFKALTPKGLARMRAEFDPERIGSAEICGSDVLGPQKINPDHRLTYKGLSDASRGRACMLQLRSPSEAANVDNVERYVAAIHRIATQLPYDSGYASLALTWGVSSQKRAFAREARRWAFRHPGFDMPNNVSSDFTIGHKLRGAYWLTFVGPRALETLGGAAKLRAALPTEVTVVRAGVGMMLRASQLPEVGDVNRLDKLPVLRAMAKVLEPVTLFGDKMLNNLFVDPESRARWERRHLD
jgi:hypothetical protein